MMYGALLGLGILTPYTSYSYNFELATLTVILLVGLGLVTASLLFTAVYQGALATSMLAGLILASFGVSVVSAACSVVGSTPIGASPVSACDPVEAIVGFVLTVLGAGAFLFGLIRLRRATPT